MLARTVREWFSLRESLEPPLGGKSGYGEGKSQFVLFFGVLAGAFSKIAYDYFSTPLAQVASHDSSQYAGSIVIACIVSIVIFPQLYYTGGLDRRRLSFSHWSLAFQNGFFWNVAFAEISSKMTGI